METQEGTENVEETSEVTESPEPADTSDALETAPGPEEVPAGDSPATGFNPAWTPLRDAIGEDFFEQFAKPVLMEMDQNAHKRITALNSELKQYEGFKPLVEQGVDTEYVQQALQVAQMLEKDPEQLYNFLSEHLGKNQTVEPELESDEEDPEPKADIPPEIQEQLDQIRQFQEEQRQREQEEAFQQEVEALTKELEAEMNEFIEKNPTWTKEDIPELDSIRYQLTKELQEKGINRIATLDEAAKVLQEKYDAYRKRFGTAAPNTLPTNAGGNIDSSSSFDPSKASRKDFENQVAMDLMSLNSKQS